MGERVIVVDYGLGNLASVERALRKLGAAAEISADPAALRDAPRAVLPGVGAFGTAMRNLEARGLREALRAFAASGRPLLGVCLGMQLFMDESEEGGTHAGLGLIPGRVRHLPRQAGIKVPRIGWGALAPAARAWDGSLLSGVQAGAALYFVHSYFVEPASASHVLAETQHGESRYCSLLQHANLAGCQAHPEKSSAAGLRILQNFLDMVPQ
jgi:glutamine amidotransferase